MATVGFSAAGIANEPVSRLRKLSAMALPFHLEINRRQLRRKSRETKQLRLELGKQAERAPIRNGHN
jgi:hypothetical protein